MKNLIIKEKLIVLFREMETEQFEKCVDAVCHAGVKLLEICFNAKNLSDDSALHKIRYIKERYPNVCVGAGTTLTAEQVENAKAAGAEFIVSPVWNEAVIKKTKALGMISIAGAYTPTECFNAHEAGADFVKIFPLKEENISYFTTIITPLPNIQFIATGGVNENNVSLFLKSGASAVGTGASILKGDLIARGAYDEIYELAKKHVEAVKN